MNKYVSIIIPAYNVEQYIRTCMDSLVHQTLEEIEIIVVNDGSTDHTGEILDQYKEDYPGRVIVVHSENRGPGAARNQGMKLASGRYIGFVDGDDWTGQTMFQRLYEEAERGYDIVVCNSIRKTCLDDTSAHIIKAYHGDTPFTPDGVLKRVYQSAAPWNKLYLRSMIQEAELVFPEMWYEDVGFTPVVMTFAKKIRYLDEELYFYRYAENSVTSSQKSDERVLCKIDAYKYALAHCNPEKKQLILYAMLEKLVLDMEEFTKFQWEFYHFYQELLPLIHTGTWEKYHLQRTLPKISRPLVPQVFHIFAIGHKNRDSLHTIFKENLKKLGYSFEVKVWGEDQFDLSQNKTVECAYKAGNYKFVNDYAKLKVLYQEGGICLDPEMELKRGILGVVWNKITLGAVGKNSIHTHLLAAAPFQRLILDLLATYQFPPYQDEFLPLGARAVDYLKVIDGLYVSGYEQVSEALDLKVESPAVFLSDVDTDVNISIYRGQLLEETYFKSIIKLYQEGASGSGSYKEEVDALNYKLYLYENSTCWKITKPIRVFGEFLRGLGVRR